MHIIIMIIILMGVLFFSQWSYTSFVNCKVLINGWNPETYLIFKVRFTCEYDVVFVM